MKKVFILAAILIIPSVFYLLISTGKNNYKKLEYYGPKEPVEKTVNGKIVTDTIYHSVNGFSLLDADSIPVTESITQGKIYVADFFFSTCKTICPKMSDLLMKVQYKFKDDPDVLILSHTVDPETDSPAILREYAKAHNAIPRKWYFLTGDKKAIYDLARYSYFISAGEGNGGPEDFIHSEQFVLIDKNKHIRGFYDGTDLIEVNKLIDEIKVLLEEEKTTH